MQEVDAYLYLCGKSLNGSKRAFFYLCKPFDGEEPTRFHASIVVIPLYIYTFNEKTLTAITPIVVVGHRGLSRLS